MQEVANFAEMLEDLPSALPGTAVRVIHATAVDPLQARYRRAELLQIQIDAMRDMYIAAFGAEAYRSRLSPRTRGEPLDSPVRGAGADHRRDPRCGLSPALSDVSRP